MHSIRSQNALHRLRCRSRHLRRGSGKDRAGTADPPAGRRLQAARSAIAPPVMLRLPTTASGARTAEGSRSGSGRSRPAACRHRECARFARSPRTTALRPAEAARPVTPRCACHARPTQPPPPHRPVDGSRTSGRARADTPAAPSPGSHERTATAGCPAESTSAHLEVRIVPSPSPPTRTPVRRAMPRSSPARLARAFASFGLAQV